MIIQRGLRYKDFLWLTGLMLACTQIPGNQIAVAICGIGLMIISVWQSKKDKKEVQKNER